MSLKDWERKVFDVPGAADRVAVIEKKLLLAVGLTSAQGRVTPSPNTEYGDWYGHDEGDDHTR